ncbi:MAG: hypothetical protein HC778_03065 [Chamaesiphon sp. CSU_1_12]|nr:hypothetical protein [Chamaesiphon sp. CSU_1_12]
MFSSYYRRSSNRIATANVTVKLVSIATILTIGNIAPGFARERLVPTGIPTSDCVAPTISIPKTTAHQRFDRKYCNKNNPGNNQKIQACQQNLAKQNKSLFYRSMW